MKNIRSFVCGLIAGGLALGMVSALAAQPDNQTVAKVIRLKGSAQFSMDNGTTWQTLNRGALLRPGTVVRTAADSRVDLILGEPDAPLSRPVSGEMASYQPTVTQNIVRIWENSILGIDKLNVSQTGAEEVSDTELDLRAGHIFGKVKRMSAASSYRVKIPNGVAGIRGTIYDLTVEGLLKVLTGAVELNYTAADGTPKTQIVTSDQKFNALTGELTPLPDTDKELMILTAIEAKAGVVPTQPYSYSTDSTIYNYVSPTTGK